MFSLKSRCPPPKETKRHLLDNIAPWIGERSFYGLSSELSSPRPFSSELGLRRIVGRSSSRREPSRRATTSSLSPSSTGTRCSCGPPGGENVTIRIVGVKAFDAGTRDDTGAFGQKAIDELKTALESKSVRVELNDLLGHLDGQQFYFTPAAGFGKTFGAVGAHCESQGRLALASVATRSRCSTSLRIFHSSRRTP